MKSYKRQLNAGDLGAFKNMSHDELITVIEMLNNERKNALAEATRLKKSKRELMWKLGYYTWDELLENLT